MLTKGKKINQKHNLLSGYFICDSYNIHCTAAINETYYNAMKVTLAG